MTPSRHGTQRDRTGGQRLFLALTLGVAAMGIGVAWDRAKGVIPDAPLHSPCHEDEALVWVDAPKTAACVPVDDLFADWEEEVKTR